MSAMKALFLFAFISSASALEPDAKTVAAAAPSAQFSRLPWGPTHQRRLERHYYVQRRSYGDNVGDAFFGMLIGFVLLVLVPIMIVAAELQAVKFSRLLTRAEQSTIPNVTSSQVSMAFPHTSHLTPTPHTSIQPKYMGHLRFRLGVRCDEMNLHTSAKSHLAPHTHTPHLEFFVRAHGTRYNPHLTPQKLMVTSWYGSYICPPQYMVPACMGGGTTAGCDV